MKRHRYAGAEALNKNNHVHKNALWPFLRAVARLLAKPSHDLYERMSLRLQKDDQPPRLQLCLHTTLEGESLLMRPEPPLHFEVDQFNSEDPTRRPAVFERQLEELATEAGFKTVLDQLRERANFRNRLLYAGGSGYPIVQGPIDDGLRQMQRSTLTFLRLFVMIDPLPGPPIVRPTVPDRLPESAEAHSV
jgi:hypothetical protein